MTTTPIGPWTYAWAGVPRPFVHPVRTPAGRVVSIDAPADHPWQHGLWFTIKFVNGENFWEEHGQFGTLRQTEPPVVREQPDGSVEGTSRLDWVRPGGTTVVATEVLTLVARPTPDQPGARVLDWDVRLTPTVDVELDRTPYTTWGGYGGLTLRGRPDWHDTRLLLATAPSTAREQVLGDRAGWCALDGPLADDDGDHEVGVVLLDHPRNPGHPVPWYASTRQPAYGLDGWTNFVNAAFLWDGPIHLAAGEELRLRYRFVVHDGRWERDRIDAVAAAWAEWCDDRAAGEGAGDEGAAGR
ncbi:MAG: DUF6807 domain-containing protein [Acidimicrobiales bacterium]